MPNVLWSFEVEDFADAAWRRRAAIPASALACMGWRSLLRGDVAGADADVAVVELTDPCLAERCAELVSKGARIVADAGRWAERAGEGDGEDFTIPASIAAVAAPTRDCQGRLASRIGHVPIEVIPDAAETATSLALAAGQVGAPSEGTALRQREPDLVAWLCRPEDDPDRELAILAPLLARLDRAGLRFLAIAPADRVEPSDLPPGAEFVPWSPQRQFLDLSRASTMLVAAATGPGAQRRLEMAAEIDVPALAIAPQSGDSDADLSRLLLVLEQGPGVEPGPRPVSAALDAAMGWRDLLERVRAPSAGTRRPLRRLMIFVDLMQDADLCTPIVKAAKARGDLSIEVVITRWLVESQPTAVQLFQELGVEPTVVDREAVLAGAAPDLQGCDALLTPVATDLRAHRRAHALVERARLAGIPTFSMQHGIENVGLTYFDEVNPESVRISSDYLFVWAPPDFSPPAPAELRRKFLHVGTVKAAVGPDRAAPLPPDSRPLAAIFENLHWHRYSDEFRKRFTNDLIAAARGLAGWRFVLKPHQGGRWASKNGVADLPENVMLIDPGDPEWERYMAPAYIAHAQRVITTPSTVALDAALAGRPAAIAGYDLDLPLYRPLPILRSSGDWISFISGVDHDPATEEAFLRRSILASDASARLLDALVDHL